MKHLVLVGACYLDTILSVPHYPEEDSKLRATSLAIRRGGNCANALEVLQQLLRQDEGGGRHVRPHLVSVLPSRSSTATGSIRASFGDAPLVDLSHCLYREDHDEPAASYIIRSQATTSRTIVNHMDLPEMTTDEFAVVIDALADADSSWWHFEGRIPDTTLACIRLLRSRLPDARVSVEVEKPGRKGLVELAAEADVVFYSRSWAESRGHQSAEACLAGEHRRQESLGLCTWGPDGAAAMSQSLGNCLRFPVEQRPSGIAVIDTIGAGDTFLAGMLYGLFCRETTRWDVQQTVRFAVQLATLKVQREGFGGLGLAAAGQLS
ncbi:Ribokinase-like protein [Ophiocordyceps camponoti-floridani]|uniref:Ribokinase-like protein n=1 Tax=Ophiocordyceps camponoti-floridani TaxID=2030778 RepID=A0A8H4Q4Q0_9HYPO|nr:Ribokinase-like protein [Ophiocordyceps camponoti-floridani]